MIKIFTDYCQPQDQAAVIKMIEDIPSKLPAFLQLTSKDKVSITSINKERENFVRRVHHHAKKEKRFIPSLFGALLYFQLYEMYMFYSDLITMLTSLLEKITDTRMMIGANLYSASRGYYEQAKMGADNGIAGADSVVKDLERYFEQYGRSSSKYGKNNGSPDSTGDQQNGPDQGDSIPTNNDNNVAS